MEQSHHDRLLILEERFKQLRLEVDRLMEKSGGVEGYVKGVLDSFNSDLVKTLDDVDERLGSMEATLRGRSDNPGIVGTLSKHELSLRNQWEGLNTQREELRTLKKYIWSVALAFITAVIGFVFSLFKVVM